METGLFLSIKDLMLLTGTERYETARKEHETLRQLTKPTSKRSAVFIKRSKQKITIREYCRYMGIDFREVWQFLRGKQWHPLIKDAA
jgi:hypothetical protein